MLKIKGKNTRANEAKNIDINKKRVGQTVQELLDIKSIDGNVITNSKNKKYYIRIAPKNINILTDSALFELISSFKVICNIADNAEILVLDKVERLEDNKNFISNLLEDSEDEIFRELLEKDLEYFKELETSKEASREFYIIIPFKDEKSKQAITNIRKTIEDKGFELLSCDKNTLKNMLQVYFERNFSYEIVKDFDI